MINRNIDSDFDANPQGLTSQIAQEFLEKSAIAPKNINGGQGNA